jgi:hypothetical protein
VEVSVLVCRPRPEVWDELERIEDHVTWMRDAAAIRFTSDQTRGEGTTFECDTRVGPVRLTDVMRVTDWQVGSTMAVAHQGTVSGTGRFTLVDAPGRATALHWSEDLALPMWLGGPAGARVAAPILRRLWRGNLERLRYRIESSP